MVRYTEALGSFDAERRWRLPCRWATGADSLLPTAGARTFRWLMELIPLAVCEGRDSDRHESRRDDQYDNSTTQAVNDAGTCGGCLCVAEGTALCLSKRVQTGDCRSCQKEASRANRTCEPRPDRDAVYRFHLNRGLMWSRRKLSDQIMFIINITKMVAGIRARRKLRRSFRRCIKYMTARPA